MVTKCETATSHCARPDQRGEGGDNGPLSRRSSIPNQAYYRCTHVSHHHHQDSVKHLCVHSFPLYLASNHPISPFPSPLILFSVLYPVELMMFISDIPLTYHDSLPLQFQGQKFEMIW
ncbi:hypothetical protein M433DRAFT_296829 [Acidomyces richmondensis BFW]|nr:MAG: hypothetical protein FE78DRAFT_448485 [Acidomyces sp. 'richmondensis']KYG44584.1 hypothetical protein M433DRAFT_296829 [Acidomyces richmondensis BFW]